MFHDLVVGDMGRPATLRYLTAFSNAERDVLRATVLGFSDETREAALTVACAGRWLKGRPATSEASTFIAGTRDGLEVEALREPILALVSSYLPAVIATKPNSVRVILPCNTLDTIAEWLDSEILGDENSLRRCLSGRVSVEVLHELELLANQRRITAPRIVDIVTEYIVSQHRLKVLRVCGTQTAIAAYERAMERRSKARVEAWLPGSSHSFTELLLSVVRGEASLVEENMDWDSDVLCLAGCTDFPVSGAVDSLSIFATKMAQEVYGPCSA